MLSFQKVEFFHRYIAADSMVGISCGAGFVIYHTNFGDIRSSSVWMIPGTWHGED